MIRVSETELSPLQPSWAELAVSALGVLLALLVVVLVWRYVSRSRAAFSGPR